MTLLALTLSPLLIAGLGQDPAPKPPAHPYAFTANRNSNNVSVIDTASHVEVSRIPVGLSPTRLVSSPDDRFVYVLGSGRNMLLYRINLATMSIDRRVSISHEILSNPADLEISPSGRWIAVGDGLRMAITIVDAVEMQVVSRKNLCPPCDGNRGAFAAFAHYAFTSDNAYLWGYIDLSIATPNDRALSELVLLEVPSGAIIRRLPTTPSVGGELVLLGKADRTPLLTSNGTRLPRIYEGISSTFVALRSFADFFKQHDMEFAEDLGLLCSSIGARFPNVPKVLPILNLADGTRTLLPAPDTFRDLVYNLHSQEMWAISPGRIATWNLALLARGPDIKVPQWAGFAEMAFTPDGKYLYYPGQDQVVVIDTATYSIVTKIPVGKGSGSVFMQGDTSPSSY